MRSLAYLLKDLNYFYLIYYFLSCYFGTRAEIAKEIVITAKTGY